MNRENEHSALNAGNTSSTASVSRRKPAGFFQERPPQVMEVAPQLLRHRTRRDVVLFGIGALAAVAGGGSLLPQTHSSAWVSSTKKRTGRKRNGF